jgi:hypothetical protein
MCRYMLLAGVLVVGEAMGQPREPVYSLDLELGAEYSDNRGRTDPPGPGSTIIVPRVVLDVARLADRWEVRAEGFVEHRISIDDEFDDDFRANLAGWVDWFIVPESLTWTLRNIASVEPINLLDEDIPDNRQQTNVLVTGPMWRGRFGPAWEVWADALFTHSYAEETDDFNSIHWSGSSRLIRNVAPGRRASLGAEYSRTSYREFPAELNDYDRLDAVARVELEHLRGDLDISAGYTWVDPDHFSSTTAPLLRLNVSWDVRERSALRLAARHELSDSVRQLGLEVGAIDVPLQRRTDLPIGSELFQLDRVELGWHQELARGRWSLVGSYREFDFEQLPELDYSEIGGALTATWRVAPRIFLRGRFDVDRRRFDVDRRRDTDYRASLFATHLFSPRWSVRGGLVWRDRDSTMAGAGSREYIGAAYLTFHAGG